ncbi:hypothetical protein DMUE_0347 [Dictyocoela muelleri]|nr:hypothetical protein DMUE_0347 [Dictyocoela muelleri]
MEQVNKKEIMIEEIVPLLMDKKVCIIENCFSNVDFLIKDVCKFYKNIEILTFYDTEEHYKALDIPNKIHYRNINLEKYENDKYFLIDDVFNFFNNSNFYILNDKLEKGIFIYRSNSAIYSDFYKFDVVILVNDLNCGLSEYLDGNIIIKDRYEIYYDLYFKITELKTIYYLDK